MLRFLLASAVVSCLGACASAPVVEADQAYDTARVARIEHAAAVTGTKVYWVNMPRKADPASKS